MKKKTLSKWSGFVGTDGTFDFEALTDAQKEQFYSDCETIAPKRDIPLTTAQRKLHTAARRPGRPRKGKGTQIVSLSIEKDLLRRAERVAKAQGVSRSDLFSRGLLAVLAAVGAT